MFSLRSCIAGGALFLTLVTACAADWPQYRGPGADGMAPDSKINKDWATKPPQRLWTITLTEGEKGGYSLPSVAEGKLFIVDHQGTQDIVRAVQMATGQEAWTFAYPDAPNANYGYARATPVVEKGKVYTLSYKGQVHCLDAKTGQKLWSRNIQADFGGKAPGWGYTASPVIDGDKLILCPGGADAAVVALNKQTGATLWKGGGSDAPGYATPVIATINTVRQYVVFTATNLIGVKADTGERLWQYAWPTAHGVNAASPLVIGNQIFITSGYNTGCALLEISTEGATKRWEVKGTGAMAAHFNSPVLVDGFIYGNSDPTHLVCLDPRTGTVKWKQAGFEKGGLVVVDGTIIALTGDKGDVVQSVLTPDGYREVGRLTAPLGGQSWTPPIVADGKLIIRNRSSLACFSLR
jgi:outer membrane protein assembly factor BamB